MGDNIASVAETEFGFGLKQPRIAVSGQPPSVAWRDSSDSRLARSDKKKRTDDLWIRCELLFPHSLAQNQAWYIASVLLIGRHEMQGPARDGE
jgi:hypothetical protein